MLEGKQINLATLPSKGRYYGENDFELYVKPMTVAEEMASRKSELEAKAKEIVSGMEGKEKSDIKAKLREADIPESMITELVPAEASTASAAGSKAPAGKAAPAAAGTGLPGDESSSTQ